MPTIVLADSPAYNIVQFVPSNIIAHIRLDYFKELYEKVDIDREDVKSVDNMLTNNLNSLKKHYFLQLCCLEQTEQYYSWTISQNYCRH